MKNTHLWQGEWIDDKELERRLPEIGSEVSNTLTESLDTSILLNALEVLSRQIKHKQKEYLSFLECLDQTLKVSHGEIIQNLNWLAGFIERGALEKKLNKELGSSEPFNASRINYSQDFFESWAPIGLLVHASPTNVFTVGVLSMIEGLLCGNVNFLKTSGTDSLFPQLFLKVLADCDPTQILKKYIYVGRLSSKRRDLLKVLFAQADGIAAWGGEDSIEGVRSLAPGSTRIIEWGHKISFAYVAGESIDHNDVLEAIARECCLIEQQACSSPQCIYVETGDKEDLNQFGQRFAKVLEKVSASIPITEPDDRERAEITSVTELCRLESCLDNARLIESKDNTWRVLVEYKSGLRASPLFRTVWVKPLSRERIVRTLRPLRKYLQTVGLACSRSSMVDLSQSFATAGVSRIVPVGKMRGGGYMGEPHDGVYALQRYCRRLSFQTDDSMKGITNFAELKKVEAPKKKTKSAVLTKEEFQSRTVDERFAHLFFKSGGSSGEPKVSTFSYQDYHYQMHCAADGLYAAGLDPASDRCINLFPAGGLYGGFLSFFTILEFLEAVQFPMALHSDLSMVAETIINRRIDVILGLPSYIIQLFEENRDAFKRYRGIKKVFFAGEDFSEVQRKHIMSEFGVGQIKAAVYGSNDAGPLGFQCQFCDGTIYHPLERLQSLEILAFDEDRPVRGENVGRLIFTSLRRKGQSIERYEIGDVGRWIKGPCPCGRTSPRFELLGRFGDVFRVGTTPFMNYKKFVNILSEHMNYTDEVQIQVGKFKGKNGIILYLADDRDLKPDDIREVILRNYEEFSEFIREYAVVRKTFEFQVELIPHHQFKKSASSGKLLHVIYQ